MNVPRTLFADASFYIALLSRADSDRDRAVAWQLYVAEHDLRVVTTEAVLWEVLNFFSRVGRSRAHEAYARLHADPTVRVVAFEESLCTAAVTLYKSRGDQEWGITDCLSFEVMRKENLAAALTLDHHFEQAGYWAVLRSDPPA